MFGYQFDYSIDVARRIYNEISSDEEAIELLKKTVEDYYNSRGIEFTVGKRDDGGAKHIYYRGDGQSIIINLVDSLMGKSFGIMLYQKERDSMRFFEQAYKDKELFGLPVYSVRIFEELSWCDMLSIDFMSREKYLSLDSH